MIVNQTMEMNKQERNEHNPQYSDVVMDVYRKLTAQSIEMCNGLERLLKQNHYTPNAPLSSSSFNTIKMVGLFYFISFLLFCVFSFYFMVFLKKNKKKTIKKTNNKKQKHKT